LIIYLPAHALVTSLEEATNQNLWMLYQEGKISETFEIVNRINHISGKRTKFYQDTFDHPYAEFLLSIIRIL
jgi:hypothetical protein